MTCKEFSDFLMEFLDGGLSPGEHARFAEHLGECPDCVIYLETYRMAVALGKAAFAAEDDPVPADVPADLIRAILAARLNRADQPPA